MALDYYRLLGIPADADQQRIRAVYRNLAKRFHPDTNHGSEAAAELFRQVNNAYRILSNPELRCAYDRTLARQREQTAAPTAPDPQRKFNHFLTSLLDAIFGSASPAAGAPAATPAAPRRQATAARPAFNFYYHLALEKGAPVYRCGKDGVYRKTPRRKPPSV